MPPLSSLVPLSLLLLSTRLLPTCLAVIDLYCDSPYKDYIRYRDFYIVTRNSSASNYSADSVCSFYALSTNSRDRFYVEALNVSSRTARIVAESGEKILGETDEFGNWPRLRLAMTSETNSVKVTLRSDARNLTDAGARFRVRVFSKCPTVWTSVGDFCFGNAASGELADSVANSLNFADAQAACGSMRANLLELPTQLGIGIFALFNQLPHSLTQNNWVGLTDYTDEGQFKYFWLSGQQFNEEDRIRCGSSLIGSTNKKCKIDERCARFSSYALNPRRIVAMDKCNDERNYVCFMPTGGANSIYPVPQYKAFSPGAWLWAVVIAVLFAIGVAIGVVYGVLRLLHSARR